MFKIIIEHPTQGAPSLTLQTENRENARRAKMLGKENDIKVRVVKQQPDKDVKFKGIDEDAEVE